MSEPVPKIISPIAHVEVRLTEDNLKSEFRKVLQIIRPDWTSHDVKYKIAIDGSGVVKCYNPVDRTDKIVVRIFQDVNDLLKGNSTEVALMKLIHDKHGFAPKIIASFINGYAYEYIYGRYMTLQAVTVEPNWRVIAKQMAQLHATEVEPSLQKNAKIGDLFTTIPEDYPTSLKDAEYNAQFQREFPSKDRVIPEISSLIDRVTNLDSPIVLCHNDLRAKNIIWNKDTGEIKFVGFENVGFSYQAQEIAYHFWKFVGDNPSDFQAYPNRIFQMRWLRCYLEHWYEITGRGCDSVGHAHVEKLYVQVNNFYLLFLFQSLADLSIFDKIAEIDQNTQIFDVALVSYKEYLRRKNEILNLKIPEVPAENDDSFSGWCVSDFDSSFVEAMYAERRTTI